MRMLQGYLFKHCVCVCVFEKTGVSVGNTLALGRHCLTSLSYLIPLVCPWSAAVVRQCTLQTHRG